MGETKGTVVVTGSQGFICSYLCKELLDKGYKVVGIDNFSKYGEVTRPHDNHPNFHLWRMDIAKSGPIGLLSKIFDADYLIAGAAMIGGISYFHKYAYDLLRTNERILCNTFDAAIQAYQENNLKRIVIISSSMVFEGADLFYDTYKDAIFKDGVEMQLWPSDERSVKFLPPPMSTYGFQKLSTEYFCKGASEQYGLPYTIVRPFNCVGVGEEEAIGESEVYSGNIKLQLSHVLPDLVNKVFRGQDPLHILGDGSQIRCYTNGKDIARGIVMAMESEAAENEDFNISTNRQTTVLELAELVWSRINPDKPLQIMNDPAYTYDVQKRVPDVTKAERLLGFKAEISLEDSVDEVIDYMRR